MLRAGRPTVPRLPRNCALPLFSVWTLFQERAFHLEKSQSFWQSSQNASIYGNVRKMKIRVKNGFWLKTKLANIISVSSAVQAWMASALISQRSLSDHLLASPCGSALLSSLEGVRRQTPLSPDGWWLHMGLLRRRGAESGRPVSPSCGEVAQASWGVRLPQGTARLSQHKLLILSFSFLPYFISLPTEAETMTQSALSITTLGPLMTSAVHAAILSLTSVGRSCWACKGVITPTLGP